MKTILLSFKGFEKNTIFSGMDMNDSKGPWKLLKKKLADIGYDFRTVDDNNLKESERILFVDEVSLGFKKKKSNFRSIIKRIVGKKDFDIPQRETYSEGSALGLKEKMLLILWEAKAIDPDNYTQETYNKFSTILTWNDDLVDNKKFFKFYHPYPDKEYLPDVTPFRDKKMLVNISMNKYSNHTNELYSARRKSITFFEQTLKDQFDLFGYGWNTPTTRLEKLFPFLTKDYQNYRGTCENKHSTLSKYKFSLCYENVEKEKGYISEKIFDCFHAKSIPIYWGAENVTEYIPKETFIDRRQFKTNRELFDFLLTIDEIRYNEYLTAIENFLKSDKYKVFLSENFAKIIIENLKLSPSPRI